jgi:hypothetical protein
MSLVRTLLLALPLLFAAGGAHAECQLSPFEFFPDRNDTVRVRATTDNPFREGPGYSFTSVTVTKYPPNGIVATLGPNHFEYHAKPGFHGRDQYTIRACATVGARKGCSTLIYDVTVR